MKSPLARLRQLSTDLGAFNALLYLVDTRLAAISGDRVRVFRYDFVEQPVATKNRLPASRGANIALRWVKAPEPMLAARRPAAVIDERFAGGAVCLVAEIDGRFCGFVWLNLRPYREDEVRSIFSPEPAAASAWDFDVFIEPAYRMGFVFPRLWDECNRFLRERGVRSTFSRISAFNPGSLAAHSRLGTRRVGSAVYLRVAALQCMGATLAPYFHLSWSDADAPTLRVRSKSLDEPRLRSEASSTSA